MFFQFQFPSLARELLHVSGLTKNVCVYIHILLIYFYIYCTYITCVSISNIFIYTMFMCVYIYTHTFNIFLYIHYMYISIFIVDRMYGSVGHWSVRERKTRGECPVPGMDNWVDARAIREMGKAPKELWVLKQDHKGGGQATVMSYLASVRPQCTAIASLRRMFPNIYLPTHLPSPSPALPVFSSIICFFKILFFLGPHLWHMEVPN